MTIMLNDSHLVDQNYADNRNLTEYASLLLQIFLEKLTETELKENLKNRFIEVYFFCSLLTGKKPSEGTSV